MKLLRLAVLPLILLAALVWFLVASDVGSNWLAARLAGDLSAPVIGQVMEARGSFKRIRGGQAEPFEKAPVLPMDLRDGDRFETDKGARLMMLLNSKDELELPEMSAASFHLWNPKDANSPIYVQWLVGQVTSLKPGVRGHAYLVKDGRLYFPGQKPQNKPLALTVLRNAPLDMQLADQGQEAPEFEPDGTAVEKEDTAATDSKFGNDPETLSNEYIDEMITSRQGLLQKCWLSRLKENPELKGEMVLQFEITRRGRVKDLKIADTNIGDETLKRCVMSVVERIPFRPFKGQEISLSYPITFE